MEETDRYAWLDESPLTEAACVTFVEGMDLAAVATAFGGSLDEAVEVAADGVYEPDFEHQTAVLRQVGEWVVVIEANGYEGSRREVLRRLATGRAVSCFWNVNALTRFSLADLGTVVTSFEALFPDDRDGSQPDALEELRAGLPWDDDDTGTDHLMLALAARITGVEFTPDLLTGPMPEVRLRAWPDDVAEWVSPRHETLTRQDPELSYALQQADEASLRRVARTAADRALASAGIHERPTAAVLDELARRPGRHANAIEAARAATAANALAAAFHAVTRAGYAVGAAALREAMFADLGSPTPPSGSGGLSGDTWLDDHWLGWAGCVTYVRGLDVAAVTAALGAEAYPAGAGPVTLSTPPLTWVRVVGEWVVVLEPGRRPRPGDPLVERLSAHGGAIQAQWETGGDVWFRHAVGGVLQVRFNGYAPEQRWGAAPHSLDPLPVPRPGFDGGGQAVGLLALAARMTGVELAPAGLDEQWEAHRCAP